MKQNHVTRAGIAAVALLGALGTASAMPAHAETKVDVKALVEALKRAEAAIQTQQQELAQQRALINKLVADQSSQKAAIEKIETRPGPTLNPIGMRPTPASQPPSNDDKSQFKVWPPLLANIQKWAPSDADSSVIASLLKDFRLYGTLDVNVSATNSGYGTKMRVGSAGMLASSIGIKGQKELWDGWKAIADLEMAVDLSTGVAGSGPSPETSANVNVPSSGAFTGGGGQLFSREAYLGVGNDTYGYVTLGRQYTGSFIALPGALGMGFLANGGAWLPQIGGMAARFDNAVVYRTPHLMGPGFSAYVTYTTGSENNVKGLTMPLDGKPGLADDSGTGWDVALIYNFKEVPLHTAITGWYVNNATFAAGETGLATKKGVQVGGDYNFGFAKLFAVYLYGEISGGNYENVTKKMSRADGYMISAMIPIPHFNRHAILAAYSSLDDKSLLNRDASSISIAYIYKLYENAWLYANYGQMFNNANASYGLQDGGDLVGLVSKPGYDPNGAMVGVNIRF